MSDLKKMYKTLREDPFPAEATLTLGEQTLTFTKRTWTIGGEVKGLRYGENPDQPAALYELTGGGLAYDGVAFRGPGQGLVSALTEEHMLQAGKHPGKINLTDVDNGINMLQYLTAKPAAVILKHNNPCGAAWHAGGVTTALANAFNSDRIAAFGGTVVVNGPITPEAAEFVNASYFEVVAAPAYEAGALEILAKRKNLRILQIPGLADLSALAGQPFLEIKSLADGGMVLQASFVNKITSPDDFLPATATDKAGTTVSARAPSKQEAEDLFFAWAVEAGVTSNSVIFAKDGCTTAIGTGEQDRVGCVELTVSKAYTKYADGIVFVEKGISIYELKAKARMSASLEDGTDAAAYLAEVEERTKAARGGLPGTVLVSDGFFPFRDGVDVALAEGVTAIAQPGGSIRDTEVIGAVNEAEPQAAMVFTGQRSFKH